MLYYLSDKYIDNQLFVCYNITMPVEIERKFLVIEELLPPLNGVSIRQGYIQNTPEKTVRVRVTDDEAYITVKGTVSPTTRSEYEYKIPLDDGIEMLDNLCGDEVLIKNRSIIQYEGYFWEVDVFSGVHAGLIVAEIELVSEDEFFCRPPWVSIEVTEDPKFLNCNLIKGEMT